METTMNPLQLKTNLRCAACVEKIRPMMDRTFGADHWQADVSTPAKWLTVTHPQASQKQISEVLESQGYRVLVEGANGLSLPMLDQEVATPSSEPTTTYYPLMLLVGYIVGVVGMVELAHGSFDLMRGMNHFMAGFFLTFSFFKLLDVRAFADAYQSYDIVAAKWWAYGLIYPFIELGLGIAYFANAFPLITNMVTLVVLGISTVGVVNSLLARRKIRCACLGSVFNLPMSYVTLIEDLTMVAMSALMLVLLLTQTGH
jgi:hypothetical protein